MRLTVLGATGGTGKHLVRQALDAGHEVTAVVRDPSRLPVTGDRLVVVTADVADAVALRAAVEGRDAVLSALGSASNEQAAASIAARGVAAALAAMDECGVRRLVVVSAAPVAPTPEGEDASGRETFEMLRRTFHGHYADLAAMEKSIRDSAAEWTVMAPPKLTEGPVTGTYERMLGGPVPRRHTIPWADLAHAMLAALDDPATVKQVVGVAT